MTSGLLIPTRFKRLAGADDLGGVRLCRRYAAVRRAAADRKHGYGRSRHLLEDVEHLFVPDHAVAFFGRNAAFDDQDVAAVFPGLGQDFIRLLAGGGHDGFVVIDAQNIKDDFGGTRVGCLDECLGAPGIGRKVEPDDRCVALEAFSRAAAILGAYRLGKAEKGSSCTTIL